MGTSSRDHNIKRNIACLLGYHGQDMSLETIHDVLRKKINEDKTLIQQLQAQLQSERRGKNISQVSINPTQSVSNVLAPGLTSPSDTFHSCLLEPMKRLYDTPLTVSDEEFYQRVKQIQIKLIQLLDKAYAGQQEEYVRRAESHTVNLTHGAVKQQSEQFPQQRHLYSMPAQIDDAIHWMESIILENRRLHSVNEEIAAELKEKTRKLDKHTESWSKALSASASADDRSRENLSVMWRPKTITELYKKIVNKYDVARILQQENILPRDTMDVDMFISAITCHTFKVTCSIITDKYAQFQDHLRFLIRNPFDRQVMSKELQLTGSISLSRPEQGKKDGHQDQHNVPRGRDSHSVNNQLMCQSHLQGGQLQTSPKTELEEDKFLDDLRMCYRNISDVDMHIIIEESIREIITECQSEFSARGSVIEKAFSIPQMRDFVKSASHLGWVMGLMKPPMRFSTSGVSKPFDEDQQIAYLSSSCNPKSMKARVKYYLSPALKQEQKVWEKALVFISDT